MVYLGFKRAPYCWITLFNFDTAMRSTLPLLSQQTWKYCTVEWSPRLATAAVQSALPADVATHYILPDRDLPNLPHLQSSKDRKMFLATIPAKQRIQTIATSRHTPWSLKQYRIPADKILLVGGHDKTPKTLSVVEAAHVLQQETDTPLWGVANPNDPNSLERVEEKINAGITGFVTQPLLSSHALDILKTYPKKGDDDNNPVITFNVGMALPTTVQNLQFWMRLLEQPELQDDPLVQNHMEYFSQPNCSSFAWIERELQDIIVSARTNNSNHVVVDGIHCMPMKNTDDLITLLHTLKR